MLGIFFKLVILTWLAFGVFSAPAQGDGNRLAYLSAPWQGSPCIWAVALCNSPSLASGVLVNPRVVPAPTPYSP